MVSKNAIASAAVVPEFKVPPLTPEEEDELIITRLANDEKVLRRLAKRYRSIAAYALPTYTPPADSKKDREELLVEAREGFLADLDAFEMMLLKNQQVCSAEGRMVRQYEMEKERIAGEHQALLRDIVQLKLDLTEAQTTRKRRMEYDTIAEQINLLPSRSELEASVMRHEEEVAVARAERDKMREEMISRKLEFDLIVSSLSDIRTKGLGKDETSKMAEEGEMVPPPPSEAEGTPTPSTAPVLNPHAKPYVPSNLGTSRPGTPSGPQVVVHPPASGGGTPREEPKDEQEENGDIEMGEVAEAKPPDTNRLSPTKMRRTSSKDELEEGEERSDSEFGSELTDLGEDA